MLNNDFQYPSHRLSRTPEQLISNGECAQIFGSHHQFSETTDGNVERTVNGRGCQFPYGGFLVVLYQPYPLVAIFQRSVISSRGMSFSV